MERSSTGLREVVGLGIAKAEVIVGVNDAGEDDLAGGVDSIPGIGLGARREVGNDASILNGEIELLKTAAIGENDLSAANNGIERHWLEDS